ncbi:uncharacterized protein ACIQIH_012910 isoform 1-T1 [Cyanocitta cristata]
MCSVPACSWKEESRCEKVSVPLEAPGKEAVNMSQNPVWMTMIIKLLFNSSVTGNGKMESYIYLPLTRNELNSRIRNLYHIFLNGLKWRIFVSCQLERSCFRQSVLSPLDNVYSALK